MSYTTQVVELLSGFSLDEVDPILNDHDLLIATSGSKQKDRIDAVKRLLARDFEPRERMGVLTLLLKDSPVPDNTKNAILLQIVKTFESGEGLGYSDYDSYADALHKLAMILIKTHGDPKVITAAIDAVNAYYLENSYYDDLLSDGSPKSRSLVESILYSGPKGVTRYEMKFVIPVLRKLITECSEYGSFEALVSVIVFVQNQFPSDFDREAKGLLKLAKSKLVPAFKVAEPDLETSEIRTVAQNTDYPKELRDIATVMLTKRAQEAARLSRTKLPTPGGPGGHGPQKIARDGPEARKARARQAT